MTSLGVDIQTFVGERDREREREDGESMTKRERERERERGWVGGEQKRETEKDNRRRVGNQRK